MKLPKITLFLAILFQLTLAKAEPSKILILLAKDGNSPIIFDERTSEYQIYYETISDSGNKAQRKFPLRFDPFTGKPLKAKREDLFQKVDPAEEKDFLSKRRNIKSVQDIVDAFGSPSRTWPKGSAPEDATQIDYLDSYETIGISFNILDDGSVKSMRYGKQIE